MANKHRPPQQQSRVVQTSVSYQGPLPPSVELEAYVRIYPDAAKVIFQMAQDHSSHQIAIERETIAIQKEDQRLSGVALNANIELHKRRSLFAFLMCILVMAFTAFLIVWGQAIAGITLFVGELAALAWMFLRSQDSSNQATKKNG